MSAHGGGPSITHIAEHCRGASVERRSRGTVFYSTIQYDYSMVTVDYDYDLLQYSRYDYNIPILDMWYLLLYDYSAIIVLA